MRLREIVLCALLVGAAGCNDNAKPTPEATTAALGDLATRQLIAGLNAKNATVLANLIVLTSTSGGPPRALRPAEMERLVYPAGPFEYEGVGKPGTIVLTDGAKMKRVVRLIRSGETFKALARSEAASPMTPDVRVISIFVDE